MCVCGAAACASAAVPSLAGESGSKSGAGRPRWKTAFGLNGFSSASRKYQKTFPIWEEWNRTWTEPPYHEDGFLLMSRGPLQLGGFAHEGYRLLRDRGHPGERIDSAALAHRFPVWNAGRYPDGYFNCELIVMDPDRRFAYGGRLYGG